MVALAAWLSCQEPGPAAPSETLARAAAPIPTAPYRWDPAAGDPTVPAALGGPRFTGEGWITRERLSRLGDPNALQGGALVTAVPDWPPTLRVLGKDANTALLNHLADLLYTPLLAHDPVTLDVAFARRLGYRANPICDWEHGRRFPTGEEALRAAAVAGVDVAGAFRRFATADAPPPDGLDTEALAAWLTRLRGATPIAEIALRVGATRFVVSRWLSGATRPRLPDFLQLVEALTRRVSDLVAALVPITSVPTLLQDWRRRQEGRRLALEVPWSGAVLRLLETTDYQALPVHRPGWFAQRLGVGAPVEAACLDALQRAGIVRWDGVRFVAGAAATIDTRGAPEVVAALKAHWAQVGQERTLAPRAGDLLSYNVISLSRADLARLRELHLAYYRAVRALVAGSEPVEVAALINVQLVTFDVPEG